MPETGGDGANEPPRTLAEKLSRLREARAPEGGRPPSWDALAKQIADATGVAVSGAYLWELGTGKPGTNVTLKHLKAFSKFFSRRVSYFVDDVSNNPHFARAAFVGRTAFAHKGGMHVNAVQKLARSYEHIEPKAVGNEQNILVSELSGQSNILIKAEQLGIKKVDGGPNGGRIEFEAQTPVDPLVLIKLIQGQPKRYKFEGATMFKFMVPMERPEERFNTVEALFERLTPTTA